VRVHVMTQESCRVHKQQTIASFFLFLTPCLTLSHSLSHSCSLFRALSSSRSLSCCYHKRQTFSLVLSLSLFLFFSLAFNPSPSLSRARLLSLALVLSRSRALALLLSRSLALLLSRSLALAHSLCRALTLRVFTTKKA